MVEVAAVELVLDLLLPHPAIARMTSTARPARARTLIIETKPPGIEPGRAAAAAQV